MPQNDQHHKSSDRTNCAGMGINRTNIDQCSSGRNDAGEGNDFESSQRQEEDAQRQKEHKGRIAADDP